MVAVTEKERAASVFVPGWRKCSSEPFFLGSGYAGVGILPHASLLFVMGSITRRWKENVSRREAGFLIGYYLVLLSILIPLFAHARNPGCWPFLCRIVNEETYRFFGYARHEIWELYGVLQAVAVSVLLFFEIPDDRQGIKYPVLICPLIVVLAASAAFSLGKHWMTAYQLLVIALAFGFCLEDQLLKKLDEPSAKDIFWLVDVPVIASLLVVTWYVGFGVNNIDDAHFFSGAIAFQFIMGNFLLVTIRTRLALSTPRARAPFPDVGARDQK